MHFPVHVHGVGQFLESEKGNSNGESHPCPCYLANSKTLKDAAQVIDKKIGILKICKQAYVVDDRKGGDLFSFPAGAPVHPSDQVKIKTYGSQNNENEFWCAPGIEKDAGNQQDDVLVPFVGQVIRQQKDGQKIKDKEAAAEYHIRSC
jgi:hypothetical protein